MPSRLSSSPSGLGEGAIAFLVGVLAFLVGVVLAGIGAAIGSAMSGYRQGSSQPMPLAVTAFDLLGLWIALVAGVVAVSRYLGSGDVKTDVGLSFRWQFDLVVGVVAGLGTQLVLIPLMYLPFEHADPSLKHRLGTPAKSLTGAVHGAWENVLLLFLLAIAAPIVEELFFRGLVLRSLTTWLGPVAGIVGSALLFGVAHGELLQLPALIVFGLVLGVLAHRSGRLGPGMVAHAAFNAVTVISLVHGL